MTQVKNGRAGRPVSQSPATPPGSWAWVYISPEKAREYLAKMPPNRKLRMAKVMRMAESMKRGNYRQTHQGIAFNLKGQLVDGQHRLFAIVESNCGQWLWVYSGLSQDALLVIDTHTTRSDADAFTMVGTSATARSVAIAKRMARGMRSKGYEDRDDLREFVEKHAEALDFVLSLFPTLTKGTTSAPCLAAIARAFYTSDRKRLIEFAAVLTTGVTPNGSQDEAGVRLRDFLTTTHIAGGEDIRLFVYRKTESALQAFLNYRPLAKLYAASYEFFPIPGEAAYDEYSEGLEDSVFPAASDN